MSRSSASSTSELLRAHCAAIAKEEAVLREGQTARLALWHRRDGAQPARAHHRDRELDHASGAAGARSADADEEIHGLQDRHVVVTGGTGALGTAVVGALLEAGAICHVPYRSEDEAQRFPHRGTRACRSTALGDLADEAAVMGYYGGSRSCGPRSTSQAGLRSRRSRRATRRC